VIVVLPDLEALTTDICDCLGKFIEIIAQNQVYQEILNEKATFVNYSTVVFWVSAGSLSDCRNHLLLGE